MAADDFNLEVQELKDEQLDSVAGGAGGKTMWVCPECSWTQEAAGPFVPCPKCKEKGKKTLMVKA